MAKTSSTVNGRLDLLPALPVLCSLSATWKVRLSPESQDYLVTISNTPGPVQRGVKIHKYVHTYILHLRTFRHTDERHTYVHT